MIEDGSIHLLLAKSVVRSFERFQRQTLLSRAYT